VPPTPSTLTNFDRVRPWIVRGLWLALPVTLGFGGQDALAAQPVAVRVVALVLAALMWGGGLLALLVPHPIGLTVLRVVSPAVLLATGIIAASGGVPLWERVLAVVGGVFAIIGVLSAETATWCIDGPAYPNESRYALSTPPRFFLITLIICVLTSVSLVVGPVLLAAKRWPIGAALVVAGAAVGWFGIRSVHQLSRRFVVFVPAGFVVHDPFAIVDPVLFRRSLVERIGPAVADTDSLDLTVGAAGVPIEVLLEEKVELAKLSDDLKTGEAGRTARFMVSPMRPGAVLKEATARKYPVS
jgi:hypothetical protein